MKRFVQFSSTRPLAYHVKFWCISLLTISAINAHAQSVEWSEKDLARSVHRAEQTFLGGEMSRAYGLFAHLVSVAGDRAFLHYRFGATCTYTSQRLNEAIEHLEIARELGILDTEEAAGWHYYKARYHHAQFQFEEAVMHFRTAIDLASNKEPWLEDAKLRFGQCTTNGTFPDVAEKLESVETLVSHSDDYFRLYEIPVSEGRLLTIPEQLRSKEDKRREYTSQLHWLPGQRFAFYSSYGKNGDTGLDVYRVSVDGVGEYGVPEKLPAPVNSDFDDCAPVCMPGNDDQTADRLFFSSSRPEALGGFDIFQVDGNLTGVAVELVQSMHARQLPFEINSTADEFLYWENTNEGEAWLTTNRHQDFEGREVWRFEMDRPTVTPVAISIRTDFGSKEGRLSIRKDGEDLIGIEQDMTGQATSDFLLAAGTTYQIAWEAKDGTVSTTERISLAPSKTPAFIAEPLRFHGVPTSNSLQAQLDGQQTMEQSDIHWSFAGLSSQVAAAMFGETMNPDAFAAIRASGIHNVGIEKVLHAAEAENTESHTIPDWMLHAMHEIGVATSLEQLPEPVQLTREKAVSIQSRMEETQCWDAPGSEAWKVQAIIERFGEPALALLSEEVRQLRMHAQSEQDRWGTWSQAIAEYVYQTGVNSEDWNVLQAYCEAQFQAYAGAYVHADDMFRRIDSHLRFERWITEALPMNIDAFRKDFGSILTVNPSIFNACNAAAKAVHEQVGIQEKFEQLQTALWGTYTDRIIGYQDLGIYTLPGMENTQSWFLRSGGIMEDRQLQTTEPDRLTKGQQAVGLAWETCKVGARKMDQVLQESEMSPGDWWSTFGPATNEAQAKQGYAGYELFVEHNDPILNQANAYQQELDVLRTCAKNGEAYQSTLKSAIAMRSSIEQEMLALFGGESAYNVKPNIRTSKTEAIEAPSAESVVVSPKTISTTTPVAEESIEEVRSIESARANAVSPVTPERMTVESMRYTVQIGAFANEPDFQGMPCAEEAFPLNTSGGLTKYGSGKFASYEAARAHLKTLQGWAKDAFIKLIPINTEASTTVPPSATIAAPVTPAVHPTPSSTPASGTELTKQFRVRIVSYTETLQPTEVATLLRLGNKLSLKTTRLSSETVYFTDTFESLEATKNALALCIQSGFNDAEIEVLYE